MTNSSVSIASPTAAAPKFGPKKLRMVAIAAGALCVAGDWGNAKAATMMLSGSFLVSDVPELLLCCGSPTGREFSSVIGNLSLVYNDAVSAPTFSPAPVISLNSFEISFGNALTGPKDFGLFDGVVALINKGPGFTNFVIQSNNPPSPGQEGFFLEIFSANGVVLPGPIFEYTQAGNDSTYYVGGSAGVTDLPVISIAVPEPSKWAMLLAGFIALCYVGLRRTGRGAAFGPPVSLSTTVELQR
jgi:hypothetical protein